MWPRAAYCRFEELTAFIKKTVDKENKRKKKNEHKKTTSSHDSPRMHGEWYRQGEFFYDEKEAHLRLPRLTLRLIPPLAPIPRAIPKVPQPTTRRRN